MSNTSTLRERNNLKRKQKLLASARALFDAQGIDQTTVSQIAKAARTSLRTVYNFFPTKLDILGTILVLEMRTQVAAFDALPQALPDDPHDGLWRLLEFQLAMIAGIDAREIKLFTAHAIAREGETVAGQSYETIDRLFVEQFVATLNTYRERGKLPEGVRIEPLARLIFSAANGLFLEWLSTESMSIDQFRAALLEHVDLLLPPAAGARRT